MVATKAALSIRVDALTDADGKSEEVAASIGLENRAKLESRLRALEHQSDISGVRRFADKNQPSQRFEMKGQTKTYNADADAVDLVPAQREPMELAVKAVLDVKEEKRRAKEERRAKKKAGKEQKPKESDDEDRMDVEENKQDKKRKRRESEVNGAEVPKVGNLVLSCLRNSTKQQQEDGETEAERKARKKARKAEKAAAAASASQVDGDPPKKKKKKTEA